MARKPAVLTRGTISGRPANATEWPRSVSTRATPRLGGRFPPPDQFSQRIRAICALLFGYAQNHVSNNCLGCRPAQPHVPAQQLPDIDVGDDDQHGEELS